MKTDFYIHREEDLDVNIEGRYVQLKTNESISLMLTKEMARKLLDDLNYLEQGGHLNKKTT